MGEFVMRLLVGMAKMASDDTSLRVKSFMDAAKRAAERSGQPWRWGRRPFGWAPDLHTPLRAGDRLTWPVKRRPPDGGPAVEVEITFEPEADYLHDAAERVVAGESLASIERDWETRGVRSIKDGDRVQPRAHRKRRPSSGHITAAGLRGMLLEPRNEEIFGAELAFQLRTTLNDPRRRTQRGSERTHLLTGWFGLGEQEGFLCGGCGNLLRSRPGRQPGANGAKGSTYECPACHKVARSAELVDQLVRDDLFHMLESWDVTAALEAAATDQDGPSLLAERQTMQARYDQLRDRWAARMANPDIDFDNDPEADALTEAMSQAKLRLLAIDRSREQRRRSRSAVLNNALQAPRPEDYWASLPVAQRRELLRVAGLTRVLLHPGNHARRLDPATVERYWRTPSGELRRVAGLSPGSRNPELQVACKCGCGELAPPGREWQPGHYPLRGAAHYNARKTRCPKGHPYDEANTYIGSHGDRQCRTCKGTQAKASAARRRRRVQPVRVANATKTQCPHGHPYDEANTGRNRDGSRYCKTCNRAKVAAWKRRQAAGTGRRAS
jgi:hypothetical protein